MIVYITGGTGQVGEALRKILFQQQVEVVLLSRSQPHLFRNETHLHYRLGDSPKINANLNPSLLIHLAHDFHDRRTNERNINVAGFKNLIKHNFSKIIFLSTPTPKSSSKIYTTYQIQKVAIEKLLVEKNAVVLKPSFIYSSNGGVNKIFNFVRKINIPIPLPKNASKLSPIDLVCMARFISDVGITNWEAGVFLVKGQCNMSFKQFLSEYHGLKSFYIPNFITGALIGFLSIAKIHSAFYLADRIRGMRDLQDIDIYVENECVRIL